MKGLLTLEGQRIFFYLLGQRVIPTIFATHTRSPNCILGLCVLKIVLSLTSLSCWIDSFGFLPLTSLHACMSFVLTCLAFYVIFFLCMLKGDRDLSGMLGCVCVCVNVSDVSRWVFAGECMFMSLFEFAFLRSEEGWEFLFVFWDFCNVLLFSLVQYFDVFIVVHIISV